ncbi:MAG: glutamate-1-semialdehyde 2,1-aminomutase [Myxococcota bacterium]
MAGRRLTVKFDKSKAIQQKSHDLIPGGAHTYAKGDDQYPELAPGFIARGQGCHVWDIDGNEFIEYNMGLRSVTLGHAYPEVIKAAAEAMPNGTNFTRPSILEVECAEKFLEILEAADMVKFTKDGSTATTAAITLARAVTGRDRVGLCSDHPFFSYNGWSIGRTEVDAGIPESEKALTSTFRYNDFESVQAMFDAHPGEISCVILEPSRGEEPKDGFLEKLRALCSSEGCLLIFDEMITGFRWHLGGGQAYFGVEPDLSTFGKALANGFSVSALAGKREFMERGGLRHDKERVFLLSTTHGAETHGLAAAIATMKVYEREPVIEHLWQTGERLALGFTEATREAGLQDYVHVMGKPCNLVFATKGPDGNPSQSYRSLFLQETIARGVLMPSLVVSYSHTVEDIDRTVEAVRGALGVYKRALDEGPEKYLVGRPSKIVYRRYN